MEETRDELYGPALPETANGDPWHPQTVALWDVIRRSPQMADEPALGWAFLLDTMLMHHTMWTKGKWEFAAELRLRLSKFGATPEDRMRLRLKVKTVKDVGTDDITKPLDDGSVAATADRRRNMRIAT